MSLYSEGEGSEATPPEGQGGGDGGEVTREDAPTILYWGILGIAIVAVALYFIFRRV